MMGLMEALFGIKPPPFDDSYWVWAEIEQARRARLALLTPEVMRARLADLQRRIDDRSIRFGVTP